MNSCALEKGFERFVLLVISWLMLIVLFLGWHDNGHMIRDVQVATYHKGIELQKRNISLPDIGGL